MLLDVFGFRSPVARNRFSVAFFALAARSSSRAFSPASPSLLKRYPTQAEISFLHPRNIRLKSSMSGDSNAGGMVPSKFKVAACQILCGEDKSENIKVAEKAVKDAAGEGAQVRFVLEIESSQSHDA